MSEQYKIFMMTCASTTFNIPVPQTEYKFHATRKWRFDLCWPQYKIALEVEGGVYSQGRHIRPSGFIGDMEKYNQAALLGWRVFRCTPTTLLKVDTFRLIKEAIIRTIK